MQTLTEWLTDTAAGTRAMMLEQHKELIGDMLTVAEYEEYAKEIQWTGRTMQFEGRTWFEFTTPGTWTGKGYAAIIDGDLNSRESDDMEAGE